MAQGHHLLIDCRNVPRETCLDDGGMLAAMARAATRAGATVISQVRYRFGAGSPPGFTAVVLLDESHCSAHTYADAGMIALDLFTCGSTDPLNVLEFLREDVELGEIMIRQVDRFPLEGGIPLQSALAEATPAQELVTSRAECSGRKSRVRKGRG